MEPAKQKIITAAIAGTTVLLQQLDPSTNCWGAKIGPFSLIRHACIDSREKAETFIHALETFCRAPSMRLSSLQLGLPETEWDEMTAEHILFAWLAKERGLSFQVAHMSLPTQPLYTAKGAPAKSEFLLKAVAKLPKMQDLDGWETYCYWLHEEMERLLETFHLESLELYTLQALLLDFVHEVRASLLLQHESDVSEILIQQGSARNLLANSPTGDSMLLEKRLIKRRGEAKEEIQVQYKILERLVGVIQAIGKSHRELQPLKLQAMSVHRLLGVELNEMTKLSWVERVLLLQLLNLDLGLITAVSCDTGYDRTSVVFAIQVAAALLRQKIPQEQLVDMALHWNEKTAEMQIVKLFRELFVEVVEKLCIPLTGGNKKSPSWHEAQVESSELLGFFPERFLRPDKKGLNASGHSLLTKISSTASEAG